MAKTTTTPPIITPPNPTPAPAAPASSETDWNAQMERVRAKRAAEAEKANAPAPVEYKPKPLPVPKPKGNVGPTRFVYPEPKPTPEVDAIAPKPPVEGPVTIEAKVLPPEVPSAPEIEILPATPTIDRADTTPENSYKRQPPRESARLQAEWAYEDAIAERDTLETAEMRASGLKTKTRQSLAGREIPVEILLKQGQRAIVAEAIRRANAGDLTPMTDEDAKAAANARLEQMAKAAGAADLEMYVDEAKARGIPLDAMVDRTSVDMNTRVNATANPSERIAGLKQGRVGTMGVDYFESKHAKEQINAAAKRGVDVKATERQILDLPDYDAEIPFRASDVKAGIMGSPEVGTDDDVAKPGEVGYELARRMITHAEERGVTGEYVQKLMQDPGGFSRYVREQADAILKSRGINSAMNDAATRQARIQAANEVIAFKTVGLWTSPIFLQDDFEPTGGSAFKPSIEIVGYGAEGEPGKPAIITRQQGYVSYAFDMLDAPQMGLVGAWKYGAEEAEKARQEEGASGVGAVATGIWRGATRAVGQREDLFKASMASEGAQARQVYNEDGSLAVDETGKPITEENWRPWVYGTVGLGFAIFSPDAGDLIIIPTLSKAARGLEAIGRSSEGAKGANILTDIASSRVAANNAYREAMAIDDRIPELERALEAANSGADAKAVDAAKIELATARAESLAQRDMATKLWAKASEREAALYTGYENLVRHLDSSDADVARGLAKETPAIADSALARKIPGQADALLTLHPSIRKGLKRVEANGIKVTGVGRKDLFDTHTLLTKIDAGFKPAPDSKAAASAIGGFKPDALMHVTMASADSAVDALRKALPEESFAALIDDTRLVSNPAEWRLSAIRAIQTMPVPKSADAGATRKAALEQAVALARVGESAVENTTDAYNNARFAVLRNSESRAMAADALSYALRDKAQRVKILGEAPHSDSTLRVQELEARLAAERGMPLSDGGRALSKKLQTAGLKKTEADRLAAIADARARKWAWENSADGATVDDWYKTEAGSERFVNEALKPSAAATRADADGLDEATDVGVLDEMTATGEIIEGGGSRANRSSLGSSRLTPAAAKRLRSAKSAKQAAAILAKDAPHAWMREIARRAADRLPDDFALRFDEALENAGEFELAAVKQRADIDTKLKRVYTPGVVTLTDETDAETALHELIHAVTANAIERWRAKPALMSREDRRAVEGLNSVFKRAQEYLARSPDTESALKEFGFTDLDEFIAEALSNADFQRVLRTIPANSDTSLWDTFVMFVRKLMGIPDTDGATALDEVLAAYNDVANANRRTVDDLKKMEGVEAGYRGDTLGSEPAGVLFSPRRGKPSPAEVGRWIQDRLDDADLPELHAMVRRVAPTNVRPGDMTLDEIEAYLREYANGGATELYSPRGWATADAAPAGWGSVESSAVKLDEGRAVSFDQIKQWQTSTDAARWIASTSENPLWRSIAERIAPLVERVRIAEMPAGTKRPVIRDDVEIGVDATDATAFYRADKDGERLFFSDAPHDERTVLHELMHAATASRIRALPDSKPVKQIARLKERATAALDEAVASGAIDEYKASAYAYALRLSGERGLHEFVAEAFSNSAFQDFLRSVPIAPKKPESLWSGFVSSVRDILGLKGAGSTALDETFQAVDDLLRIQIKPSRADNARTTVPDFGRVGVAEGFFSPLQKALTDVLSKSNGEMPADSLLAAIAQDATVKADELEWSGIASWLRSQGNKTINADEIAAELAKREPIVQVVGAGNATKEASKELRQLSNQLAEIDRSLSEVTIKTRGALDNDASRVIRRMYQNGVRPEAMRSALTNIMATGKPPDWWGATVEDAGEFNGDAIVRKLHAAFSPPLADGALSETQKAILEFAALEGKRVNVASLIEEAKLTPELRTVNAKIRENEVNAKIRENESETNEVIEARKALEAKMKVAGVSETDIMNIRVNARNYENYGQWNSYGRKRTSEVFAKGSLSDSELDEFRTAMQREDELDDELRQLGREKDALINTSTETVFGDYVAPGQSSNYREIRFLQNNPEAGVSVAQRREAIQAALPEWRAAKQAVADVLTLRASDPDTAFDLANVQRRISGSEPTDNFGLDYSDEDIRDILSGVSATDPTLAERLIRFRNADNARAEAARMPITDRAVVGAGPSVDQHFEPNTIAHLRTTDRVGPNGERILFVEEIQSDWHQAGKKSGYRQPIDEDAIRQRAAKARQEMAAEKAKLSAELDTAAKEHARLSKEWDEILTELSNIAAGPESARSEKRRSELAAELESRAPALKVKYDSVSSLIERNKALSRHLAVPEGQYERDAISAERVKHEAAVNPGSHSELWVDLAIKQALSMAAREGYDGVAFNRGVMSAATVGGKLGGQVAFYDQRVPAAALRVANMAADGRVGDSLASTRISWTAAERDDAVRKMRDSVRQTRDALRSSTDAQLASRGLKRASIEKMLADQETAIKQIANQGFNEAQPESMWRSLADQAQSNADLLKSELASYKRRIADGREVDVEELDYMNKLPARIAEYESKRDDYLATIEEKKLGLTVPYLPISPVLRERVVGEGLPLYAPPKTPAPSAAETPARAPLVASSPAIEALSKRIAETEALRLAAKREDKPAFSETLSSLRARRAELITQAKTEAREAARARFAAEKSELQTLVAETPRLKQINARVIAARRELASATNARDNAAKVAARLASSKTASAAEKKAAASTFAATDAFANEKASQLKDVERAFESALGEVKAEANAPVTPVKAPTRAPTPVAPSPIATPTPDAEETIVASRAEPAPDAESTIVSGDDWWNDVMGATDNVTTDPAVRPAEPPRPSPVPPRAPYPREPWTTAPSVIIPDVSDPSVASSPLPMPVTRSTEDTARDVHRSNGTRINNLNRLFVQSGVKNKALRADIDRVAELHRRVRSANELNADTARDVLRELYRVEDEIIVLTERVNFGVSPWAPIDEIADASARAVARDSVIILSAMSLKRPEDAVKAMANIIYRDLDDTELAAIELAGLTDPEKFATAFVDWMRKPEKALQPQLKSAFESVRQWLASIVKTVKGEAGADSKALNVEAVTIDPGLDAAFSALFNISTDPETVRRVYEGASNATGAGANANAVTAKTKRVGLLRGLFGPDAARPNLKAVDEIAKAAQSVGLNIDAETIARRLEDGETIEFPAPVLGRTKIQLSDLSAIQKRLEEAFAADLAKNPVRLSTGDWAKAITEETAVDKLWNFLRSDAAAKSALSADPNDVPVLTKIADVGKVIGRAALTLATGADEMADLRHLPPAIRQTVLSAVRLINTVYGNALQLAGERDFFKMVEYLTGTPVKFRNGRRVASSGYDSVSALKMRLDHIVRSTDRKGVDALMDADDFANMSPDAFKAAVGAAADIIYGNSLFSRQLVQVVGMSQALTNASDINATIKELGIAKALVLFTRMAPEPAIKMLHSRIASYYTLEAANKSLVLVAAHGQADRVRKLWFNSGVAIPTDDANLFKDFMMGEDIPEAAIPVVREVADKLGFDPRLVPALDLTGRLSVPEAAYKRLTSALSKATPEKPHFLMAEDANLDDAGWAMRGLAAYIRWRKSSQVRGSLLKRNRFIFGNMIDLLNMTGNTLGIGVATAVGARIFPQNALALAPFATRIVDVASRLEVVSPEALENVRDALQSLGDKAANGIMALAGQKVYGLDVNRVLDGDPTQLNLGGRYYRASDIRETLMQEGALEGFAANIESAVRKSVREPIGFVEKAVDRFAGWLEYTADVNEALQERERVGVALTLIELGVPPRLAARLTTRALFDYLTSTAPSERSLPMAIFLPYWPFTKNANRGVINNYFGGWAGHRLALLRRVADYSTDAANELIYGAVADPYGVAYEQLSEEGYQNYLTMRAELERHYGGVHKVPFDIKLNVQTMFMGGSGYMIHDGKIWVPSARMQEIMSDTAAFQDLTKAVLQPDGTVVYLPARLDAEAGVIPDPDRSASPSYNREFYGIAIPMTGGESLRRYMRMASPDHPFTEIILPESYVQSAFRHVGGWVAALILLTMDTAGAVSGVISKDPTAFELSGQRVMPYANIAREIVDPERALVLPEIASMVFNLGEPMPIRIHALIAKGLDQIGISTMTTNAASDPYSPILDPGNKAANEASSQLNEAVERNLLPTGLEGAGGQVRGQRHYVPPTWGLALKSPVLIPIMELNTALLQYNDYLDLRPGVSPLERAASPEYAAVLSAVRMITGVRTTEVSRSPTALREEPRRATMTAEPKK